MSNILENANVKQRTTKFGWIFILISASMYVVLYIVPVFVVLKQEIPYEWWTPIIPLIIGIVLVFINDDYFARIFNRSEKIVAKKTDTE